MIINVSGRTDIVAFYTEWFMNRYHAGFLDVRNPFYKKQVSRIEFSNVDLILFCTKNPIPIIDRLKEIDKPILFHITLTPYKEDVELNVISKTKIIEGIKKISKIVGIDNVYVRYDPIFISDKYTIEYHVKAFHKMCSLLNGYVNKIIISFIDDYKNVRKNSKILNFREFSDNDFKEIGINFSKSAKEFNMTVQTCCEDIRLIEYGFIKSDCITKDVAFKLTGKTDFKKWKARNSDNCNCVSMSDIGVYNTCSHFCKYCYANYDEVVVKDNMKNHDKNSTMLIGELESDDIVKIRK